MRKLTVLIVALLLAFAAMPAAVAHGSGVLRGSLEGGSMPIFDADAVDARCPEGYEWILQTFGAGEMRTAAYTAEFTYVGEHCSRWLRGAPDSADRRFPGQVGDGVLMLSTPDGDLALLYSGRFSFQGDAAIPDFTSKVWLRYRVDGEQSTGVFANASGRGHMFGRDDTGLQTVRLIGSIDLGS